MFRCLGSGIFLSHCWTAMAKNAATRLRARLINHSALIVTCVGSGSKGGRVNDASDWVALIKLPDMVKDAS